MVRRALPLIASIALSASLPGCGTTLNVDPCSDPPPASCGALLGTYSLTYSSWQQDGSPAPSGPTAPCEEAQAWTEITIEERSGRLCVTTDFAPQPGLLSFSGCEASIYATVDSRSGSVDVTEDYQLFIDLGATTPAGTYDYEYRGTGLCTADASVVATPTSP